QRNLGSALPEGSRPEGARLARRHAAPAFRVPAESREKVVDKPGFVSSPTSVGAVGAGVWPRSPAGSGVVRLFSIWRFLSHVRVGVPIGPVAGSGFAAAG